MGADVGAALAPDLFVSVARRPSTREWMSSPELAAELVLSGGRGMLGDGGGGWVGGWWVVSGEWWRRARVGR